MAAARRFPQRPEDRPRRRRRRPARRLGVLGPLGKGLRARRVYTMHKFSIFCQHDTCCKSDIDIVYII